MGEFGKCSRDPLGGRSLDTELGIQQYAADLVDQAASDDPVSGYSATEVPGLVVDDHVSSRSSGTPSLVVVTYMPRCSTESASGPNAKRRTPE